MAIVRAKSWIKYGDGKWAAPGEVFQTENPEALTGLVEEVETEQAAPEWVGPSAELMPEAEKPKRTAKRGSTKKNN